MDKNYTFALTDEDYALTTINEPYSTTTTCQWSSYQWSTPPTYATTTPEPQQQMPSGLPQQEEWTLQEELEILREEWRTKEYQGDPLESQQKLLKEVKEMWDRLQKFLKQPAPQLQWIYGIQKIQQFKKNTKLNGKGSAGTGKSKDNQKEARTKTEA